MTFSDKKPDKFEEAQSNDQKDNDEYFNKRKTLKTKLLENSFDEKNLIQDNQKNKLNKKYNKNQNTPNTNNIIDSKLKSEDIKIKHDNEIIKDNPLKLNKIDTKHNLD